MFFHEVFKVGKARTNGLALVISPGEHIGGLESVARDAGDGELIGLDAPVCIQARGNRGG